MADLCQELADVLDSVTRPGSFCAGGRETLPPPRVSVDGVGELSLPLLSFQADQLIASAERAPYGRGPDTLVDTTVRRTWQISPGRVRFAGRQWTATLEHIVARAAAGLGVEATVVATIRAASF